MLFLVPGIARIVGAVRGKDDRAASIARFLLCWAVPTWLVFELLPTKLPHYVLPAYPALALIAGWAFVEIGKSANWQRWVSWGLFALAGLVFAIIIPTAFLIYGNNASWDAVRLSLAGFQGGFDLTTDPTIGAVVVLASGIFAALVGATLVSERLRSGVLVLALVVASGLAWQVGARGLALPNAYAVRLADQVRAAQEYAETVTGVSPDEIVTASSYTEPSLVFSLGSDTVLGTTEEVLAFAENREEPTMVVLDLSRDADLRRRFTGNGDARPTTSLSGLLERILSDQQLANQLYTLNICSQSLASGTNYSRGDETVLVILYTRCADDDAALYPEPRIAGGTEH